MTLHGNGLEDDVTPRVPVKYLSGKQKPRCTRNHSRTLHGEWPKSKVDVVHVVLPARMGESHAATPKEKKTRWMPITVDVELGPQYPPQTVFCRLRARLSLCGAGLCFVPCPAPLPAFPLLCFVQKKQRSSVSNHSMYRGLR